MQEILIGRELSAMLYNHNPDPATIPCHRVVNREGKAAPGFAFGGGYIQRQQPEAEDISFEADGYSCFGKISYVVKKLAYDKNNIPIFCGTTK